MCGIAGFWGKGSESVIGRMTDSLAHRGPDFLGTYYDSTISLGFGHARLSILDLTVGANQPFFSEDKRYAVVFNGEIYNFRELRQELLNKGYGPFLTSGDTEVLLKAFQAYGISCLSRLNGMFAFAIFDFEKKELFLAKDRLGKKPLYYTQVGDTFVFASELKAILKHPDFKKKLNFDALNHYLTLDYVPTPLSIFEGVVKLEGGHYLIVNKLGKITCDSYWSPVFDVEEIQFEDAKEQLDYYLNDATAIRLIADVPVGVFLSGGLDSSAIAYYAQKNSISKIETFSVGFNEITYDESSYAKLVAQQLGTNHHELILTAKDSMDLIPSVYASLDEPFADPSILPTYLLSNFTRKHVTVALGGDGSDELLAGYPTFVSDKFADAFSLLPVNLIKKLFDLVYRLPASDTNISFDFKIRQFLKGFESDAKLRHSLWLGSFTPNNKKSLFNKDIQSNVPDFRSLGVIDNYASRTSKNELIFMYLKTYLQDDILFKVDRASMMNALEVRAPFLDYRVVEFVNKLPHNFKMKGLNGKYILKETMRGRLPGEIIDRPKKGFGIPVSLWLKNELRDLCSDLLSKNELERHGIFNYSYIENLKNSHFSGMRNSRKELWNLMIFQLWYNNYLK